MTTELLGLVAGSLGVISSLPQIRKLWRTRSGRDVSLLTPVITFISALLWVVYGVETETLAVFITQAVNSVFVSVLIALKIMLDAGWVSGKPDIPAA